MVIKFKLFLSFWRRNFPTYTTRFALICTWYRILCLLHHWQVKHCLVFHTSLYYPFFSVETFHFPQIGGIPNNQKHYISIFQCSEIHIEPCSLISIKNLLWNTKQQVLKLNVNQCVVTEMCNKYTDGLPNKNICHNLSF